MRRGWSPPPRVIGHRGSPREAVENTLASFDACLAAGVAAAELDARLSADGAVVVHHDAELGRSIPGNGRIEETIAHDLVARGIPLLRDVLARPMTLDVEMKADAANAHDLPRRVLDAVLAADALDRVLVTSFDHELADAYARLASRPAGMIVPYPPDADELASWPRLRVVALAEDAAIPEAIASCRKADRDVLVWTVNDERAATTLLGAGAAGIITDRPGPLLRATTGAGPAP